MSISVELSSPQAIADPFPLYATLRDNAPVYRIQPQGWWAVSRYNDVMFVLRNHDIFSSDTRIEMVKPPNVDEQIWEEIQSLPNKHMVNSDPPAHTRLRKLVSGAFTPRTIAQSETVVRTIVNELIDDILKKEEFELIQHLAGPLPVTVIAVMLGVDPGRRMDFKRWADNLHALGQLFRYRVRQQVRLDEIRQSRVDFFNYLGTLIAERRVRPKDDLVSGLIRSEVEEGRLTVDEVLMMCIVLLVAATETTRNLISNGTLMLLTQSETLAALRADPSQIPRFVEEVLRYDGSVKLLLRRTTRDVTISGVTIPQGEIVMAVLSSANRDPAEYPDPDRFDMHRDNRGHMAFGYGIHFCFGAALARIEGRITFEEMVRRLPPFSRVSAELDWNPSVSLRSLQSLPLRFDRGAQPKG